MTEPKSPGPLFDGDSPRRQFLGYLGLGSLGVASGILSMPFAAAAGSETGTSPAAPEPLRALPEPIELPLLQEPKTERETSKMPVFGAPDRRVGFAIVGLGRLSLDQILPAFGASKWARPVALVSGDAAKARRVGEMYGVPASKLFSYANFDRIADHPEIQAVYLVLPNSLHAEFTVRAARAGKHVLCEKPMATSVADCERMIKACQDRGRKLMIAYRSQYEPHHRAVKKLLQGGALGEVRQIIAQNGQNQHAGANQWRQRRALAGGGALPDVGIYCLNTLRFITGEEPVEISAQLHSPAGDARFREVEDSVQWMMRFPSGIVASCATGYSHHESRFYRVLGSERWLEMSPAFGYHGLRLKLSARSAEDEQAEDVVERVIEEKNQFALELDHFADCVVNDRKPYTPGEEGLQDQRLVEAIYESARTGRRIELAPVKILDAFRGPAYH